MRLNWISQYDQRDGYGRFSYRLVNALQVLGVDVKAATFCHLDMPPAMQRREGLCWRDLTVTCAPPFSLRSVPGRLWLYSMTEGSRIPAEWVARIEQAQVERVIVPCEHNRSAFRDSGVRVPISVVPGGTDPAEFAPLPQTKRRVADFRPYIFLTFADRGSRKGWEEVWQAFYKAFGGKTSGIQDVRLVVKSRAGSPSPVRFMSQASDRDQRIVYQVDDVEEMQEVYAQADCLALPSRSEGWGMIHREAAAMGLPVITQKYAGLDDGCTEEWALVIEGGRLKPIPAEVAFCLGEWMIADPDKLAQAMLWAYHSPETADGFGRHASRWLHQHQTWRHSASLLMDLVQSHG